MAWSLLAGWAIIRLVLIPPDPAVSGEFSHDSGYISTVTRNLAAGRGYVNDAHWLLFLNPPKLPMAYHNANPLYPTLAAIVSVVGKVDTPKAAALVSAASSVLLAFGVFWLVRRFSRDFRFSILAAAAAVLWPSNFRESFTILPDALCTSLSVCALATLVYARRWWMWCAVGILLGLAWLTCGSALLILPGIAVWILLRDHRPWIHLGLALAVMALTISPWLVHTARTRGSALASDNGYFLLHEYHAYRSHRTPPQAWRSLDQPPTLGRILQTEAVDLGLFIIKALPRFVDRFVRALYDRNRAAGVAFWVVLGLGVVLFPWRAMWHTPEFIAAAVTIAALTALLIPRANSIEIRYWSVAHLLLLLGLLTPFAPVMRTRWPRRVAVLAASLIMFTGILDAKTLYIRLRTDPVISAYRQIALAAQARMETNDAAIAEAPYLFTYFTGKSAISPPYPSKVELLQVMRRYGARFVLLSRGRLDEFYPGAPEALAPELRVDSEFGGAVLFKLN